VPAHATVSGPEWTGSRGGPYRRQSSREGWSLLCNGIVIFEDTGELLPGGASIAPHRPTDLTPCATTTEVVPATGSRSSAA